MPQITYAYSTHVIPGGETIGIEVNSKGVLIVGFYKVNNQYIAKEAGFKTNDLITEVNNIKVENIEKMVELISTSETPIKFKVIRNSQEKTINFNLKYNPKEILKTGILVKDKINGIGTLSYIDPTTKIFGSLGHEIVNWRSITK